MRGLGGLGPAVGVYAPDSLTHTATIGEKYYDNSISRGAL